MRPLGGLFFDTRRKNRPPAEAGGASSTPWLLMPGCLQGAPSALQDDPMHARPRSSRKLFEGARPKL
eukprot:1941702-Pyramimonas_sp.AAC.1